MADYRPADALFCMFESITSGAFVSELVYRAVEAKAQAGAYTAALLSALGSREPIDVMRETPAILRGGVLGLTSTQLGTPEAPAKWSIVQLLQHLADSDLVNAYRFRMVLAQDRAPLIGYDQDYWAEHLHAGDTDAGELLTRIEVLRRSTVRLLTAARPADLQRVGMHAERGEESIPLMMRLFAGHDIVHRRQLARIRLVLGVEASI